MTTHNRLSQMLAEGYELTGTLTRSNKGKNEAIYIPKRLQGRLVIAYVFSKDGKECVVTEDI